MTTAGIGATGRVGSEIVRGLPARGDAVTVLVRDHGKGAAPSANPTGCTSACAVPPSHKTAGADAGPLSVRRDPSLFGQVLANRSL